MKFLLLNAAVAVTAMKVQKCPLNKVLGMLADLKGRLVSEGKTEAEQYEEYDKWCRAEKSDKKHAIDTGSDLCADKKATIEQLTAAIGELNTEVADLASSIQKNEADLASATALREKEHADFSATEKELTDSIDTLARASSVLRKGGMGGPALKAAMAQIASSMDVVLNSASIDVQDRRKLSALLEASTQEDDDLPTGAPEAAAYESHSDSILDTLADLKVKAEGERSDARKEESNRKHAYEMLRQSLSDQISTQNRDMRNAQSLIAKKSEAKGNAEGDLDEGSKTLSSDKQYLSDLVQMCDIKASDWASRQKSRSEELAALQKAVDFMSSEKFQAAAGRAVNRMTNGAGGEAWQKENEAVAARARQFSFMELSSTVSMKVKDDDIRDRVAALLQATADKVASVGLAQLAQQTRMGDGPFDKVKGLISDMIAKLTDQAAKETNHNAFCESETAESKAKRDNLSARADDLSTRVDASNTAIAELKAEIADLSKQVAEMDTNMAEATALRQKENAEYTASTNDLRVGQEAISGAIAALQEYYQEKPSLLQGPEFGGPVFSGGLEKKSDSANGIVAIVENCLNLVTNMLSQAEAAEQTNSRAYNKMKDENEVNRAMKVTESKTKTQEVARLTNLLNDLSNDRESNGAELDAVLAYIDKLKAKCEHKPMSFEERAARRQTEIDSLKQAMDILENETA